MQIDLLSQERLSWPAWAGFLHRYRLENLAACFLEAAGPLTILGAQALYLGGPLLAPAGSKGQINALADLLEDPDEVMAFAVFLRTGFPS